MLLGGSRTFRNKEKKDELIKLIKDGYSDSSIARYFHIDHTSIFYHRKQLLINTIGIKEIKIKPPEELVIPVVDTTHPLLREPVNKGKTYAGYLAEERKRHPKRTLEEIISRKLKAQRL